MPSCSSSPPAGSPPRPAAPASRPADAAPDGPVTPPSPIPDQGTVTKTLNGVTVAPQVQGSGPGDVASSAAIRKAFLSDTTLSARARDITVNASNGKVTLRGTVASAAERTRIEILARDACLPGTAIDDQLDVGARP